MLRSMVKEDRRIRRTLWKEKKEGRDGGRESESRRTEMERRKGGRKEGKE